jgi:DNA-binding response OmpR family regulator
MSTATSTLDHPAATADRRVRVLLVEDTDAVRRAVALGLRSSGFAVTAVRGGQDALAVYAAVQPQVIITDLAMRGMDGFELIATLRVRGVEVPVLVITARDSARDRAAAFAAGADGYLLKPFGLVELCEKITTLADRRATIQE